MAIQYEDIVQDSLRGVVKTVLEEVKENGFSENQHLYITFKTDYPGVKMTEYLKERHPDEVTIVLQYQFWDLEVRETFFSVSLSFNDVKEHLVVPYAAVTGFVDPSVKFGLQFTPKELGEDITGVARENKIDDSSQEQTDDQRKKTLSVKEKGKAHTKVVSMENFRKKR